MTEANKLFMKDRTGGIDRVGGYEAAERKKILFWKDDQQLCSP